LSEVTIYLTKSAPFRHVPPNDGHLPADCLSGNTPWECTGSVGRCTRRWTERYGHSASPVPGHMKHTTSS